MEFISIQFLCVMIFSIVVMGRNYTDESELKFLALNQSESAQNFSETENYNDEGFEAKGQLISICPFVVIVWTKIPSKKIDKFCPRI